MRWSKTGEARQMMGQENDYKRWRESEAARLVAAGRVDTDTVRELLILSCHSSPLAERFFESRLDRIDLLVTLLGLAADDYSGDAQMTASYWVSRFPPELLASHISELKVIARNEWDSVSVHARNALVTLGTTA